MTRHKADWFARCPQLNDSNLDGTFMRVCANMSDLKTGLAYKRKIETEGRQASVFAMARFLNLVFNCRHELTDPAAVVEVEAVCADLSTRSDFLDATTTESLILGLALTDKWRDGLELLERVELTCKPRTLPMCALAQSALTAGDIETSIALMQRIVRARRDMPDFVLDAWLEEGCRRGQPHLLHRLVDFLGRHRVWPNAGVADRLGRAFQEAGGYTATHTTVDSATGRCGHCNRTLQSGQLDDGEYARLRAALMERVVLGDDVFLGSNPAEIDRFRRFVAKEAPFDIVVDGMNVAYRHCGNKDSHKNKMMQILHVVQHFSRLGAKVLVLVKKHTEHWWPSGAARIRRSAFLYTIQDMSRDDVFILYATVHSGRGARFVSSDYMRDHVFRMRHPDLEALFQKWQRSSQLHLEYIDRDGRLTLRSPVAHLVAAQCHAPQGGDPDVVDVAWHVPYDDGKPRETCQPPDTWLCLQPSLATTLLEHVRRRQSH